jgi:hypothetical protein
VTVQHQEHVLRVHLPTWPGMDSTVCGACLPQRSHCRKIVANSLSVLSRQYPLARCFQARACATGVRERADRGSAAEHRRGGYPDGTPAGPKAGSASSCELVPMTHLIPSQSTPSDSPISTVAGRATRNRERGRAPHVFLLAGAGISLLLAILLLVAEQPRSLGTDV